MDQNFGEFITNEYGLIRQILSYLKPVDLYNARNVCREWRKAVDNVTDKNPVIISYQDGLNDLLQKKQWPYPKKPILPKLVIGNIAEPKKFPSTLSCKVCFQTRVCCCEVAAPETSTLTLVNSPPDSSTDHSTFRPELYSFWQTPLLLALSCSESVHVTALPFNKEKKGKRSRESLHIRFLTDVNEPVKGVFVLSSADGQSRKTAQALLNEILDRQGPTFAVGGGVNAAFNFTRQVNRKKEKSENGLIITFAGDNVSAHSELVTGLDQPSIEKSMSELRERAGEVPKDGIRVAFIAQCVERTSESLEKLESGLFTKYFPNVPQCGFRAWGEFGIKSGSSDDLGSRNKNKRRKLDFSHVYTTSILILTVKKLQPKKVW